MVLRARREIFEGEEITINYIPPIYGVPKRKLEICNEWYFNCKYACFDKKLCVTFLPQLCAVFGCDRVWYICVRAEVQQL